MCWFSLPSLNGAGGAKIKQTKRFLVKRSRVLGVAGISKQTQHWNCSCRLEEESGEKPNQPVLETGKSILNWDWSKRAALKNKVTLYWTYLNEAMIHLAYQTNFNRKSSLNSVLSRTSTTSERSKLLKQKNSNTVHLNN